MKQIVIVGGGAGGRWSADICIATGSKLAGYLDISRDAGDHINGIPVLGRYAKLEDDEFLSDFQFCIAIGDPFERRRIADDIRARGAALATLIHPGAFVAPSAQIGSGCVINTFSYVHANAVLGELVVVENHTSVGIANVLGDGAHVTTGCMLNGYARIGARTFVGSGAVVIPNVTVGHGCVIGAGATVIGDLPDNVVAVGTPARVIRKLAADRVTNAP